jgi:hypothetical protein
LKPVRIAKLRSASTSFCAASLPPLRAGALMARRTLERAEFSSLKLSAGDDMRAQIERAGGGYRVSVKSRS